MATHRSFFVGQTLAGEGNAFCGLACGEPTDRTAEYGVHVWNGAGRLMLCCPACAEKHALHLVRLVPTLPAVVAKPVELMTMDEFIAKNYPALVR
jgi:hypothetical protein